MYKTKLRMKSARTDFEGTQYEVRIFISVHSEEVKCEFNCKCRILSLTDKEMCDVCTLNEIGMKTKQHTRSTFDGVECFFFFLSLVSLLSRRNTLGNSNCCLLYLESTWQTT